MREKIIIRIRRKSEFNGYWAFLITSSMVFGAILPKTRTTEELFIILFALFVIIVWAPIYQGFEVIRE